CIYLSVFFFFFFFFQAEDGIRDGHVTGVQTCALPISTYRSLGGSRLAPEVVQAAIPACYEIMERIYNDPARCDSFPRVLDTLRTLPQAKGLDERELKLLEDVIARHERGQIPDSRSEEHTSELQSRGHLVCRLLLEKKKSSS